MNTPLKPDPNWTHTNGAGWHRPAGGSSIFHPPAAYALGFEEGAYALATEARSLLETNNLAGLVELLGSYERGSARPTQGWEHEPKRN